jgi:NADPH:quinone reductase-like Zn-dependent oxidoreductase
MKAIVQHGSGPPGVLELRDIGKPAARGNEVLVRVRAAAVNPADWHVMRGVPYVARLAFGLREPKARFRGTDVAGHVEVGHARGSPWGYRIDSWHFLLPICRIYAYFKGHFSGKKCQ